MKVQQALVSKKESGGGPGGRMGGGGMGGRGGPHTPGRGGPPQDEGWNTVPISKNRPIDTSRLSKITKVGEKGNFSPSLNSYIVSKISLMLTLWSFNGLLVELAGFFLSLVSYHLKWGISEISVEIHLMLFSVCLCSSKCVFNQQSLLSDSCS